MRAPRLSRLEVRGGKVHAERASPFSLSSHSLFSLDHHQHARLLDLLKSSGFLRAPKGAQGEISH